MRLILPLVFLPLTAHALDLGLPIDCTLGSNCYIQQYPDRDPGPQARDFTCGPLVYDGHDGTDFALPSLAAMDQGVNVLAAAPGIVRGMRDGMQDRVADNITSPDIAGRECGNGVVIDHEGGWQTQYCHMKQGSLAVKSGDRVEQGTALGQVGLSGAAQFPHVEFLVRKDGAGIDPFDPDDTLTCGQTAPALWKNPVAYQPGGLIAAGYADHLPTFDEVKAGLETPPLMPQDAPALVAWVYLFGAQAGDQVHYTEKTAEGDLIMDFFPLEKTQAAAFRAFGKKRSRDAWPPGVYQTTFTHKRGDLVLGTMTATVTVAP